MHPSSDPQENNPEPEPRSAQPAHLGWRLLAMVYDLFPVLALCLVASGLELLIAHGRTSDQFGPIAGMLVSVVPAWLVTSAYFVMSWRRGGATIGMRPWRLKVLAADGRPAAISALCLRYAVATLSLLLAGLGFAWALFDDERRCWHDIASGTRFVRMDQVVVHATDDRLIARLQESAKESLRQAGQIPSNIRGITFSWKWEPDPNDALGRLGLRITWRTYFEQEPSEHDREFIDDSSAFLVCDLWSRIVWVEDDLQIVPAPAPLLQLNTWLYLRDEQVKAN